MEIPFQSYEISYNIKMKFGELSDIFFDLFLDVLGPSLFSKVNQAMNLTVPS